jgi:alpha-ketoglutarate-dependent taurine dioxygenase
MLDRPIGGDRAWVGGSIDRGQWLFPISADCLAELQAAIDHHRSHPLPVILVEPGSFRLEACSVLVERVRRALDDGPGFALLDRLPLEEFGAAGAQLAYWLLGSLLARPVAQKFDGSAFLYEVKDTGRPVGNGVRRDSTKLEIRFHTDNAYNDAPPDYVGLLCVRPAKRGGVSQVMSFYTAHNALLAHHRTILPRLYQPFLFDRQREHASGDSLVAANPIFRYRDGLRVQLAVSLIRAGYRLADREIDEEGDQALGALDSVLDDVSCWQEFEFRPGQIQFLNNRTCGHKRTAFEDDADPNAMRLLIRLWLRDWGDRSYPG